MAKFCTKCGKKLENGKTCSCVKESKTDNHEVEMNQSNKVNEYVNQYIDVVKGIFTRPVETIKKYATSENFVLGLIMIAINCVITGLFAYLGVKELFGNAISLPGYGSFGLSVAHEVEFSLVFKIALFMVTGFAGTAAMLYLIAGSILKTKSDIKQLFSLVGVCSVFTTITTIVALICVYISLEFMSIVLLLSGVLYLAHLYHGFLATTEVDENKVGYTYTTAIAVATFLVVYVLPKLFFN